MSLRKPTLVFLCAIAMGQPIPVLAADQKLTVPNVDADHPPCVVLVPSTALQCAAEGCAIAVATKSVAASIQLNFSCLPTSVPTGFENPAADAKVRSIRARGVPGHMSLIDGDVGQGATSKGMRELNFCLYGKTHNFCGNAKVLRQEDGAKGDASAVVRTFVESIELQD